MKLKEEWRNSAKNKGEPLGPPSFLFEPWRGARVGSHRCPILRVRLLKYSIPDQTREKPFDHATVLIRRPGACESLRLPASSMRPLDLAVPARRETDCGAARSPQDDRTDFIGVGRSGARTRTYLTVRGRPRRDG